jgi:hypothetical protein
MINIILIPLYCVDGVSLDQYNKYKELVDINLKNIKTLNIDAEIEVINKKCKNLREMWVDIIEYIFIATKNGKNVLYMEADTILFKNCNEIFKYNKMLCFGLNSWNMSFITKDEFKDYEYFNSGLVYFPSNCDFTNIIDLYRNWPEEGNIDKLKTIFPNFNFNFGNRALDYSGTYWEYIINILFYSQFNSKENAIEFIGKNIGLWKYNYRGCEYSKYPIKNLLVNNKNISHAHFFIHSSNRDKNTRFIEIKKIFNEINKVVNNDDLLNNYIVNINDDLF